MVYFGINKSYGTISKNMGLFESIYSISYSLFLHSLLICKCKSTPPSLTLAMERGRKPKSSHTVDYQEKGLILYLALRHNFECMIAKICWRSILNMIFFGYRLLDSETDTLID